MQNSYLNYLWILLVLIVLWIIWAFNSLVSKRNRTLEAWSDIDIQLKRRYDLIPNLIEAVKGYMKYEQDTLKKVIDARANAMAAHEAKGGDLGTSAFAENQLAGTLKTIFALAEAYPDLKANQNFLQLQDELSDTENKIQAARRFYNGNVLTYNTAIEQFPTNLIAGLFNFDKKQFFEVAGSHERETPKVSL